MFNALLTWFEKYRTPFPEQLPGKPPDTLIGFVVHYAKPFWPLILASGILSTTIALIEVYLFSFIGNLVDWLTESDKATFWDTHQIQIIIISLTVLIVLPILKLLFEVIIHQGMLGNFAMRTRWEAHRYLLRQSVRFFQDDFAGRVATKMMQTSLGVRDTVMKFTEVLLYVVIYFTGAVVADQGATWFKSKTCRIYIAYVYFEHIYNFYIKLY